MKIKDGFILRKVGGQNVVVAVGERSRNFNGIIRLNETGTFLWDILAGGSDEDGLTAALLEEYDVDEGSARNDVCAFVDKLRGADLLE